MERLILKNPDPAIALPDWVMAVEGVWSNGDHFLVCLVSEDGAIALLTQMGFEVWAEEFHNLGWVAKRL